MKIWLTRHGQTRLNLQKRMQGRTDEPLNETGIQQAREQSRKLEGIHFDAVYASPLCRAVRTASLMSGVPEDKIQIDDRLIEVDFGRYEQKKYYLLGPSMTLYWALPEVFPVPDTVESIPSMIERSRSFLEDLKKQPYENVLITCHGGIMRVLSGCLENHPKGYKWRPKPHNCEIRQYEL